MTCQLRILVVDDDRDTADSSRMVLKSMGHSVLAAFSGTSAIQAAKDFQPDVVILDLAMPGVSGLELAGNLRSEHAKVVLIAVSGLQSGVRYRINA